MFRRVRIYVLLFKVGAIYMCSCESFLPLLIVPSPVQHEPTTNYGTPPGTMEKTPFLKFIPP
mgnify:CR=1 FL=1